MRSPIGRRAPAVAAVFVFLMVGTAYSEVVPPWEVPDEPWHAAYIEALAASRFPTADETYEAHQPPLYYAFAAAGLRGIGRTVLARSEDNLYFPFDAAAYSHPQGEPSIGPVRLLRRYSSLLAAVTIVLAWATAMAIGGSAGRPAATIAALVVALLPQHVFIANGLNNDTAAALAGAAISYGCVRWVQGDPGGRRGRNVLSTGVGLGLATKLNVLALLPMAVIGAIFVCRDSRRGRRRALTDMVAILLPSALIASVIVFALPDLWHAMKLNALERALRPVAVDLDTEYLQLQVRRTLSSAIGRFGWLQVDLPSLAYRGAAIMYAVSVAGLCALSLRLLNLSKASVSELSGQVASESESVRAIAFRSAWPSAPALMLLTVGIASLLAAVLRNLIVDPQPQGRLLFPALGGTAVLFAFGWLFPAYALSGSVASRPFRRALNFLWVAVPVVALSAMNFVAIDRAVPNAFERSKREPPAGQQLVRLLPDVWHLTARLERPGHSVVQTISIPTSGLARISVPLENVERTGMIVITLRHPASGVSSSASHDLERAAYERWAWIDVEAPPDLPQSEDEALELEIQLEGDGVAVLWGSLDDFYGRGQLKGDPVGDDTGRDLVLLFHYRDAP